MLSSLLHLDVCFRLHSPHDLKVMTSEKDFKSELNATQNLMLCMGLSQRTVLHCTQEFVDNDLKNFITAVPHVLQEVSEF